MSANEAQLYSLSEANKIFAKKYNGDCWSYLGNEGRSKDDTDKMINLAHASLLHWSESKECSSANLQRGEWLISWAYAFAGRAEPAYYHARRCLDLTFGNQESMIGFDIAYAYMAMARVSALMGSDKEAREYLAKMTEAADHIKAKNKVDTQIFISDLGSGNWYGMAASVQESIKLLAQAE